MATPDNTATQTDWIVMHCATQGCFTAIRMKLGAHEAHSICRWCVAGESHTLRSKPAVDIRLRQP
jgi:hypothetical protein